MSLQSLSETIRREVKISEVLNRYGFVASRSGFICCPFHNEKTASMKIFEKTNSFYCFGCGTGGDIFKFIQELLNISFSQAVLRLASDFGIIDTQEESEKAASYRARRRRKKCLQEEKERVYIANCHKFYELSHAIYALAPKSDLDNLHPYFVYSLNHINDLRAWLDDPQNIPERRK